MISYNAALEIIKSQTSDFGKEQVDIDDVCGRVLAEKIVAERDYPPFNRAAMDGIAIQIEDFDNGIRNFQIIENIFAGQGYTKELSSGQCYKIMTGASVPPAANAVIRLEDLIVKGDTAVVHSGHCFAMQNIAFKGQDLEAGSVALNPPLRINASAVGFLASLGKQKICVYKKPRVVIFTTGNEVVALGEKANDFQIYNSNLHLIKAMLLKQGIRPEHTGHVADDKENMQKAMMPYLNTDILILTGGVSAGDSDFIPVILEAMGVEILFHKVAIKPGKPFLCGKLPGGGLVFALPGNPLSCLVTYKVFVETYLHSAYKLPLQKKIKLPLNFERIKKSNADEFFPVFITEEGIVEKADSNGPGDIRLGHFANALGVQPAGRLKLKRSDEIECILL